MVAKKVVITASTSTTHEPVQDKQVRILSMVTRCLSRFPPSVELLILFIAATLNIMFGCGGVTFVEGRYGITYKNSLLILKGL